MRRETDATQPFVMDDAERVYLVERGYLDIFAVELEGDRPVGRRRFVTRVAVGEMAFGADRAADPARAGRVFGFLAVPGLDAVIIEGERAGVAAEGFDLAAVTWIDAWISKLSEFAVRGCAPPRNAVQIEADPNVSYPSGSVLSAATRRCRLGVGHGPHAPARTHRSGRRSGGRAAAAADRAYVVRD